MGNAGFISSTVVIVTGFNVSTSDTRSNDKCIAAERCVPKPRTLVPRKDVQSLPVETSNAVPQTIEDTTAKPKLMLQGSSGL